MQRNQIWKLWHLLICRNNRIGCYQCPSWRPKKLVTTRIWPSLRLRTTLTTYCQLSKRYKKVQMLLLVLKMDLKLSKATRENLRTLRPPFQSLRKTSSTWNSCASWHPLDSKRSSKQATNRSKQRKTEVTRPIYFTQSNHRLLQSICKPSNRPKTGLKPVHSHSTHDQVCQSSLQ